MYVVAVRYILTGTKQISPDISITLAKSQTAYLLISNKQKIKCNGANENPVKMCINIAIIFFLFQE